MPSWPHVGSPPVLPTSLDISLLVGGCPRTSTKFSKHQAVVPMTLEICTLHRYNRSMPSGVSFREYSPKEQPKQSSVWSSHHPKCTQSRRRRGRKLQNAVVFRVGAGEPFASLSRTSFSHGAFIPTPPIGRFGVIFKGFRTSSLCTQSTFRSS